MTDDVCLGSSETIGPDRLYGNVIAELLRQLVDYCRAEALHQVTTVLDQWDGAPAAPSQSWLTTGTASFTGFTESVAQLALLTAIAPYQVDGAHRRRSAPA